MHYVPRRHLQHAALPSQCITEEIIFLSVVSLNNHRGFLVYTPYMPSSKDTQC
uniref:Uncharacterized protein n=1 Tax=Onchocerca volvulus TaxID=6282 RepID=A0A8R1XPN8_ONCVO